MRPPPCVRACIPLPGCAPLHSLLQCYCSSVVANDTRGLEDEVNQFQWLLFRHVNSVAGDVATSKGYVCERESEIRKKGDKSVKKVCMHSQLVTYCI